jgi:pimeloyl-ACP methyl ester carboxylesterase
LATRDSAPTLYRTRTHDGVKLALWHYRGTGERDHPVLLVHGLGSNRFDVDVPGRNSLARFLNRAGFDAWIIELRGAGASRETLKKVTRHWFFDDYLIHDIPAAFRLIEEETGKPQVHWVGHSMGGMIAYPILAVADQRVRSCVTIGAPSMTSIASPIYDRILGLEPAMRWAPPAMPGYRIVMKLGSRLTGVLAPVAGRLLFNVENCDMDLLSFLAANAIEDVPTGVVLQFFEWYRTKKFRTHYGTVDVLPALERSRAPLLVVAGNNDILTPLADVRAAYDRSGAASKELLVCGRETGFATDYGHVDLVLGRRAPDEVFPRVLDWFVRHDREPAKHEARAATAKTRS